MPYRFSFGLDGMIYQIVHIRFNTNSQLLISNWLLVSIFAAQYALYGIFSRVAIALLQYDLLKLKINLIICKNS